MVITWHGQGCIKIVEKELTVLINPHSGKDLPMSKMGADIVLLGNENTTLDNLRGEAFTIDKPGEYEVKNVFVYGIDASSAKEKRTIWVVEIEGVIIAHLGGLSEGELSQEQLEKVEWADILIIPVGGHSTMSATAAVKLTRQLEPRLVVPIEYKVPGLKIEADSVDKFLKEAGGKLEKDDKLKIVKKDLIGEDTKVFVINLS